MRERLLRLLAISERPDPPPGAGSPLETFRASPRFFHYSVLTWIPKQIAAAIGLLLSLMFFGALDQPFLRAEGWERFQALLDRIFTVSMVGVPLDSSTVFLFFEALAVAAFVGQFLFSGLLLKLSWELRWYMVGEQALRLREGLWRLNEQTMTIANIQTMIVKQGPLQRLFGISDLEIHTAGGGSGGAESGDSDESKSALHVGRFRGLDDAEGLRDRIRQRLIGHRGAGLGDHDEEWEQERSVDSDSFAMAASDLLDEVRALRGTLEEIGAERRWSE